MWTSLVQTAKPNRLLDLFDALVDPKRRERTVLVVLGCYALLWTLYAVVAKSSQDIHFDMGEMLVWSRATTFGTPKHPPLGAWLVRGWFSIFPQQPWFYDVLAVLVPTLALWIAWKLFAHYLDPQKRVVGVALLTLVPFFNFHALKYNANTVMMLTGAIVTVFFVRSLQTRSFLSSAFTGAAAAAAVLAKYWSIFLLVGLLCGALIHPLRRAYFRSPAPYIAMLTGAFVLAPHIVWLYHHDFAAFAYALASHPAEWSSVLLSCVAYPIGALAYLSAAIAVLAACAGLRRAAVVDTLWPSDPDRRMVLVAFVTPLFLPAIAAILSHETIVSLWTMGSMTLFPVVLLSSPLVQISRTAGARMVAIAIAFPAVMVMIAPAIAIAIHRNGVSNYGAHYELLADEIGNAWRTATRAPLNIVGGCGNLVNGIIFYAPGAPVSYDAVVPGATPWVDRVRLAHEGAALVSPTSEPQCVAAVTAMAAGHTSSTSGEVTISRQYLGMSGPSQTYLIVIIPPG
jgi:Dolichyl-phosphate-mannose-protein mannosyltransferase